MKVLALIRNKFIVGMLLTLVSITNNYSQSIDKEIAEYESYIHAREELSPGDLAVKDSQIKSTVDLEETIQWLFTAGTHLNRMSGWISENVEKIRKSGKTTTTISIGDLVTVRKGQQDWSWFSNGLKIINGAILKQNMLLAKTTLEKRQCEISLGESENMDEVKLAYRDALKMYWEFLNSSSWSD